MCSDVIEGGHFIHIMIDRFITEISVRFKKTFMKLLTTYTLERSQVAWSPLGFKRSATLRVPVEIQKV